MKAVSPPSTSPGNCSKRRCDSRFGAATTSARSRWPSARARRRLAEAASQAGCSRRWPMRSWHTRRRSHHRAQPVRRRTGRVGDSTRVTARRRDAADHRGSTHSDSSRVNSMRFSIEATSSGRGRRPVRRDHASARTALERRSPRRFRTGCDLSERQLRGSLGQVASGRFLVEELPLSTAPSVTALAASAAEPRSTEAPERALIVTADASDAAAIAKQYPSPGIMSATDATRARFLAEAPVNIDRAPGGASVTRTLRIHFCRGSCSTMSRAAVTRGRCWAATSPASSMARTRLVVLDEVEATTRYRTARARSAWRARSWPPAYRPCWERCRARMKAQLAN